MKKFLVLPIVLLSFCVIADDRIILGSFEGDLTVEQYNTLGHKTLATSILFGVGASLFNFKDDGLYFGTSFKYLTGDRETCFIFCESFNAQGSMLSGEIGRVMGQWIPFVGLSFHSSEIDSLSERVTDESWGLNIGFWFDYDKFKIRGALTNLNDGDYRAFSFGRLFQRDNNVVLGVDLKFLIDSEVHQVNCSLQIGRFF
ncbi:MAG: hypothetical protein OXH31_06050 [Gammaproteobacteria bacterium]|nr:hypothetical protein [Gammaproteobacteria bacterium]